MKKIVFGLLLVVLAVGCLFSANAAGIEEQYLEQSYALFGAKGNYYQWSLNDKVDWLKILLPASADEDEQTILRLLESKDELLIDAYLAKRFRVEGHPDAISIHYVLEEAWGESFAWTIEQQAQQTIWIETYMPNEMWDIYHCEIPPSHAISPEDAIRIAKTEAIHAGLLESDAITEIAVSYGVHRRLLAEMPCHYVVDFRELRTVDGEERMVPTFSCYVTSEGEMMDSSYSHFILYNELQPSPFPPLPNQPFSAWTLEEKAAFSDEFYSDMDAYMCEHPNYRGVYYFATRYRYGLPDEKSISQKQAEQLARDAAVTIGADDDDLSRMGARFFFDVTNAEKPLWKVYLSTLFSENTRYGDTIGYFVIIDAHTGLVVDKYEHTNDIEYELFY